MRGLGNDAEIAPERVHVDLLATHRKPLDEIAEHLRAGRLLGGDDHFGRRPHDGGVAAFSDDVTNDVVEGLLVSGRAANADVGEEHEERAAPIASSIDRAERELRARTRDAALHRVRERGPHRELRAPPRAGAQDRLVVGRETFGEPAAVAERGKSEVGHLVNEHPIVVQISVSATAFPRAR